MRQSEVIVKAVALLVAFAGVAATAGYLTGRTENSSVIGAAVATALLGAVLGWCILASKDDKVASSLLSSLVAIVFCGVFLSVMNREIKNVELVDRATLEDELRLRLVLHQRYLEWCSEAEFRINRDRADISLPPLSSEIVCRRP